MLPNGPYTESIRASSLIPNYNDPNRLNLQLNLPNMIQAAASVMGIRDVNLTSFAIDLQQVQMIFRSWNRTPPDSSKISGTGLCEQTIVYTRYDQLDHTTRVSTREIYIFWNEAKASFPIDIARKCVYVCVCVRACVCVCVYISASRSASGAYLGCDDWATRLR